LPQSVPRGQAGRLEQTLVIVMSDHGMPFPGAKASPYESGHHCPLLIARPGDTARRCNALVNWQDLYPTICDVLGLDGSDLPDDLPGRSLLGILDQPEPQGWDQTFYSHNFHEVTNYYPYRVLRERRYKFVQHLAHQLPLPMPTDLFDSLTWQAVRRRGLTHMGSRSIEDVLHHAQESLYDLQADPCETANLIDRPDLKDVADRMRRTLMVFREKTKDPWLELDYQQGRTSVRI
jgi:N-sulfoglucosamine sulfohydrolase